MNVTVIITFEVPVIRAPLAEVLVEPLLEGKTYFPALDDCHMAKGKERKGACRPGPRKQTRGRTQAYTAQLV